MKLPNETGKRIAVVGSRDFDDNNLLFNYLSERKERISLIVSGGARGADTLATRWAQDNGVPYLVFPALWHDPVTGDFIRGAGFKRNRHIVQNCDVVLAFWDGQSNGTANTIQTANELKIPVQIVSFEPKPKVSKREKKKEPVVQEAPLQNEEVLPQLPLPDPGTQVVASILEQMEATESQFVEKKEPPVVETDVSETKEITL